MFWNVITHTPLFVWLLLALLVWGGLRSRKAHTVSWRALLIVPMIMFVWSIYALWGSAFLMSIWAASMGLGIWLGYLTLYRLPIGWDTARKALIIPGSYMPLILSLSIFALRYTLGTMQALVPGFVGSFAYLTLESGASIVSGMFLGRLLCCKLRVKPV
jgi:hypothetical protein